MSKEDERNLLEETTAVLERNLERVNVMWVGSADGKYAITWQQFCLMAASVVYDSGFGAQEIAKDLIVVGPDWWLERHEYDGSEGWVFKRMPTRLVDPVPLPFSNVAGGMWNDISEMNEVESCQT